MEKRGVPSTGGRLLSAFRREARAGQQRGDGAGESPAPKSDTHYSSFGQFATSFQGSRPRSGAHPIFWEARPSGHRWRTNFRACLRRTLVSRGG
jgi:hypothetical protein